MEYIGNTIINSSSAWTTKYCPQNIDDVVGNVDVVNILCSWLVHYSKNKQSHMSGKKRQATKITVKCDEGDDEDSPKMHDGIVNAPAKDNGIAKSCLLITGKHGIGKTCVANAVLNSAKFVKQTINFSKIKKGKDAEDTLNDLFNNTDIESMIMSNKKRKSVIIIDDVEAISSGSGKSCIMALLKHNSVHWACPVIFISNGDHSKLLTEIRKNSTEIKMNQPSANEMTQVMNKITKKEGIKLEVVNEVMGQSQMDYTRMILTLYDLKNMFGTKLVTKLMFEEYVKISKTKDDNFDLFKVTNGIINKYEGIDNCMIKYKMDKVILPLMMLENYVRAINGKTANIDQRFDLACRVSESLSRGDVVENYIYGEQNWDIIEVHGFETCVAPSWMLNSNCGPAYVSLSYPSDLNKSSISKINKKNISNASKVFTNKNIDDYIHINSIIAYLVETNQISKCTDLVKDYNIEIGTIESLLKIDKIKQIKIPLSSKQKKEFTNLLE